MTPHTTIEEACEAGYLIGPRDRTAESLFVAWRESCRERDVPCCRVRLSTRGDGGSVTVGFPPLRRPSLEAQQAMRDYCEWAVSTNQKNTQFQVCRHEVHASFVEEADLAEFVREIASLWEADRQ